MKAYAVMLFIFIFGFVTAAITESGLSTVSMPEQKTAFTGAEVKQVAENAAGQEANPLFQASTVITMFKVLGGGMVALLTILPWLISWGVPIWLAMVFQGPLWLVEASGFYQMLTGYNFLGMD